jgi:hypothetical protein
MTQLELRKQWKHLYAPPAGKVALVDVPDFKFVMIDGQIEPGESPGTSPAFQDAMQALYGAAYTLKFMSKLRKDNPIDYSVMALEALWWVEGGDFRHFDITRPEGWKWTAMILQPDHITRKMYQEALLQLAKKKPSPALDKLRFERFREGLCIQIMHIGPYSDEPRTVEKMEAFARENGYAMGGKHHEIYMGNPLRAKPDKLKTILRHPIERIK